MNSLRWLIDELSGGRSVIVSWFNHSVGLSLSDCNLIVRDHIGIYNYSHSDIKWLDISVDFDQWRNHRGNIYAKLKSGELVKVGEDRSFLGGDSEILICHTANIGNVYCGIERISRKEQYLVVKDLDTKDTFKKLGRFIDISTDGHFFYVDEWGEMVVYSTTLGEIWKKERSTLDRDFGTINSRKVANKYFTEKLLVVNEGVSKDTKIGQVTAYYSKDGKKVWSYEYTGFPEYCFLKGNFYYIVLNGDIIVLDAKSGKVEDTHNPQLGSEIFVSVQDGYFLIGSNDQRSLSVYDINKKSISSSKPLPEGYKLWLTSIPDETEDYTYFSIKPDHPVLHYCYSGLVAVPNTGKLDDFRLEPRLDMPMMITQDSNGDRSYVFTVSCNSLDDLRRLASVDLAECAYIYGEPLSRPITKLDENHKGKIKLVVDKNGLPDDAEEQLNEWAKGLSDNLKELAVFPGAGHEYRFNIEIEMS